MPEAPGTPVTPDEPDEPEAPETPETPDVPVGSEVGMLGPDFTASIYGGGEFDLADTRGRVTVINFWATWCGPCVKELPHFQALQEAYPDVAVIAVHSDLVTDDVEAFLAQYDYTIPFALDESGIIVYNTVGSVTYELLESVVSPLIEK